MTNISVWKKYKNAFDRHEAGETYREIASDLGVSVGRARELTQRWKHAVEVSKTMPNEPWIQPLISAGMLGGGKRSPVYAYA